jgi:hypothetical protein
LPGTLDPASALTDMPNLEAIYLWIALLRRHKALILAKNVLYMQNPMKIKNAATDALPLSGALFFAAAPKGLEKRA